MGYKLVAKGDDRVVAKSRKAVLSMISTERDVVRSEKDEEASRAEDTAMQACRRSSQ